MLHVFLCAVSWGLSGRVWLCTWCCLEVRVRLNCLCGACSNCNTLGGLLSSVLVVSFLQCFRGVATTSFLLAMSFLFVPFGWPAFLHSVVERVALYGFQLLLARWCVCLWMLMVDGLTRSVFFTEGPFGVPFYCVYWLLVIDSWGAKRCRARVCCPILCILCLLYTYCFTDSVVCGYERISREF